MWNTRIVWRVFQVPLKFFVTNYYIFIVCVQSFASAVQSDFVRRLIGFCSPSNRIPFAVRWQMHKKRPSKRGRPRARSV